MTLSELGITHSPGPGVFSSAQAAIPNEFPLALCRLGCDEYGLCPVIGGFLQRAIWHLIFRGQTQSGQVLVYAVKHILHG